MALTAAPAPPPDAGQRTAQTEHNLFETVGYPCILLFLFFCYSRVLDLGLSYLHLPLLFGGLAALAVICSGNLKAVFQSRITLALLLFTVWLLVEVPFSTWKTGSLMVFRERWLKAMIIFLAAGGLVTSLAQVSRVMRWIAWGLIGACTVALASNTTSIDGRLVFPSGELSNTNQLAFAATAGITMLWVIVGDRRRRVLPRVFAGLCLTLPLAVLSRTGSRAGLICFALLTVAGFLGASKTGKLWISAAFVLASILFLVVSPAPMQRRFTTIFRASTEGEAESAAESALNRLALMRDGITLTLHNPVFGVGPGNYVNMHNDMMQRKEARSDIAVVHNTYIQISSECGIPALLLYLAAIVFSFRALRQAQKCGREAPGSGFEGLGHVAFCIRLSLINTAGFFFFTTAAYDFYFPTLAGLVVAVERITLDELRRQTAPPVALAPPPDVPVFLATTLPAPRRNRPGLTP